VGHFEIGQVLGASRDTLVARLLHAIEKEGTGIAGAEDLAGGEFDEVRMVVMQTGAAEFAVFDGAGSRTARAGEATQDAECLLVAEIGFLRHGMSLSRG